MNDEKRYIEHFGNLDRGGTQEREVESAMTVAAHDQHVKPFFSNILFDRFGNITHQANILDVNVGFS